MSTDECSLQIKLDHCKFPCGLHEMKHQNETILDQIFGPLIRDLCMQSDSRIFIPDFGAFFSNRWI
jgi:hypothetical protein